jgi:hypothetical protein
MYHLLHKLKIYEKKLRKNKQLSDQLYKGK